MPAIVQAYVIRNGGDPFWVLTERYPPGHPQEFYEVQPSDNYRGATLKDGLMAPPAGPIYENDRDTLGMWHYDMQHKFDIGTLFCVVAGLLNILVIYDAFAGPAIITPEQRQQMEQKRKKKRGEVE